MQQDFEKFHEINRCLMGCVQGDHELGLFHGKLGMSIYLYHLARAQGSHAYYEAADNLIVDIFERICEIDLSENFEDGYSGIAWGISYLVNSDFVDADLKHTLGELDDKIYMFLADQMGELSAGLRNGILGYIFYYYSRLESSLKTGHNSDIFIFRKVGAELLNQLGQLIEEGRIQNSEPQLFTIFWDLPLVLLVLAESKRLNVNAGKADRLIDFLVPYLVSLFPSRHSNRLYLLLGIESIMGLVECSDLRNHAKVLKKSVDIEFIFNNEFKSLNIHVLDGVSGLLLILDKLFEITKDSMFLPLEDTVLEKISNSIFWSDDNFYRLPRENIGFVSGLSGIGWAFLKFFKVRVLS